MGIPLAEEADGAFKPGPLRFKVHEIVVVSSLTGDRMVIMISLIRPLADVI